MRERLTKSDVEKIKAEIEHRKLVERKELIEAVKEARSHGDLSENFEYHAAKKAKNQNAFLAPGHFLSTNTKFQIRSRKPDGYRPG